MKEVLYEILMHLTYYVLLIAIGSVLISLILSIFQVQDQSLALLYKIIVTVFYINKNYVVVIQGLMSLWNMT